MKKVIELLNEAGSLPIEERVAIFNAVSSALRKMVAEIGDDPVLSVQLIPTDKLVANDYNPNHVATPEMELLTQSIDADGLTMPVVAWADTEQDRCITIDGFHRRSVLMAKGRKWIPCSVIDKDVSERMASTIRHNRARGKHQVDLMASLVRRLLENGCDDATIAERLGMTPEELLRLRQVAGAAKLLAGTRYSREWSEAVTSE